MTKTTVAGVALALVIGCSSSSTGGTSGGSTGSAQDLPPGPFFDVDGGYFSDTADTATCAAEYDPDFARGIVWDVEPDGGWRDLYGAGSTWNTYDRALTDGGIGKEIRWRCSSIGCDHPRYIDLVIIPNRQRAATDWFVTSETFTSSDPQCPVSTSGTTGGTTGGGTTGGGTTCHDRGASCGCSNFKKSECGGLCCTWRTGQGCGCF